MNLPIKIQGLIYRKAENGTLEFLALKRIPKDGGFWQPVTGTVEQGETLKQALLREIAEETQISHIQKITDLIYEFTWEKAGQTISEYVFGVEVEPHTQIKISHEHSEYKWIPIEQIKEVFTFEAYLIGINKLVEYLK